MFIEQILGDNLLGVMDVQYMYVTDIQKQLQFFYRFKKM